MPEKVYKPGDSVPQSGVYRVVHGHHRPDHEATLLKGGQFPRCLHCGENVRFHLQRASTSIQDDSDFEAGR